MAILFMFDHDLLSYVISNPCKCDCEAILKDQQYLSVDSHCKMQTIPAGAERPLQTQEKDKILYNNHRNKSVWLVTTGRIPNRSTRLGDAETKLPTQFEEAERFSTLQGGM